GNPIHCTPSEGRVTFANIPLWQPGEGGFPTGNSAGAGSGGLPNPAVCGAPAADGIPRSKI
ncbi:hypothetical protein ACNWA9_002081, partial [Neisseria gonorrhoeae]